MFTKKWWKDTIERVLSTAAQATIGMLAVDGAVGLPAKGWWLGVGVPATASFLKCVVASQVGDHNDASLHPDV